MLTVKSAFLIEGKNGIIVGSFRREILAKYTEYKHLLDNGKTVYDEHGNRHEVYESDQLLGGGKNIYIDGKKYETYDHLLDNGKTVVRPDKSSYDMYTCNHLLDNGKTVYADGNTYDVYSGTGIFGDHYTHVNQRGGSYGSSTGSGYGGYDYTVPSVPEEYSGVSSYAGFVPGSTKIFVPRAGAVDIIITTFGLALSGAALWWYTTELPVALIIAMVTIIILGIAQRNKYHDADRQSIWYMWSMIFVTLVGYYMVQHKGTSSGGILIEIAFWGMPIAYLLLMASTCAYATGDINDGGVLFLCIILIVVSWFITIYRARGPYEYITLFMVVQDILFIIVLLIAFITLIKSIRHCRISSFVFPIICIFVYMMARELTGFYGFSMIWEKIASVLG